MQKSNAPYSEFENLASIPNLKHGVFSRIGGVSLPPFDSLNTAFSGGDAKDCVFQNILIACNSLEIKSDSLITTSIVHGSEIVSISSETDFKPTLTPTGWEHLQIADGIICSQPNNYLMMSTADCALAIVVAPRERVVGLFHAGWKGIVSQIVPKGIGIMRSLFGCSIENMRVALTPSIGPCCYQLKDPAQKAIPGWGKYLADQSNGFTAIDLRQALKDQIILAGIASQNLEANNTCTACNGNNYFSFYAQRPKTGRMATIVGFSS